MPLAGGNVTPCSFLVDSTTLDNTVVLASGTSTPIVGISGVDTRRPPGDFFNNDTYHAVLGENVTVFKPPMKQAYLQLGGTVTAGDLLTSDGNGFGVTATAGQQVGARTNVAGVSGQVIEVQPVWGPRD